MNCDGELNELFNDYIVRLINLNDSYNVKIEEYKKIVNTGNEKFELLSLDKIRKNPTEAVSSSDSNFDNKIKLGLLIEKVDMINKLNDEIFRLNQIIRDNEIEINKMIYFIDGEEKFIDCMNKDIESLKCTINRLNMDDSNQFLKNQENKCHVSLKDNSDLYSIINDKENQIVFLKDSLVKEHNIAKKYEQDNNLLYEDIQSKNLENSILKGMIEDNVHVNENLLLKNSDLNKSISKKNNRIIQLNKNLSSAKEKINLLERIINEKNSNIEFLDNEISVLKDIIAEKDKTISLLRGR